MPESLQPCCHAWLACVRRLNQPRSFLMAFTNLRRFHTEAGKQRRRLLAIKRLKLRPRMAFAWLECSGGVLVYCLNAIGDLGGRERYGEDLLSPLLDGRDEIYNSN